MGAVAAAALQNHLTGAAGAVTGSRPAKQAFFADPMAFIVRGTIPISSSISLAPAPWMTQDSVAAIGSHIVKSADPTSNLLPNERFRIVGQPEYAVESLEDPDNEFSDRDLLDIKNAGTTLDEVLSTDAATAHRPSTSRLTVDIPLLSPAEKALYHRTDDISSSSRPRRTSNLETGPSANTNQNTTEEGAPMDIDQEETISPNANQTNSPIFPPDPPSPPAATPTIPLAAQKDTAAAAPGAAASSPARLALSASKPPALDRNPVSPLDFPITAHNPSVPSHPSTQHAAAETEQVQGDVTIRSRDCSDPVFLEARPAVELNAKRDFAIINEAYRDILAGKVDSYMANRDVRRPTVSTTSPSSIPLTPPLFQYHDVIKAYIHFAGYSPSASSQPSSHAHSLAVFIRWFNDIVPPSPNDTSVSPFLHATRIELTLWTEFSYIDVSFQPMSQNRLAPRGPLGMHL